MRVPRAAKAAVGLGVFGLALSFLALPYLNALAFIARAADLSGAASTLADWRSHGVAAPEEWRIPTRHGSVRGRLYRPADGDFFHTILLMPGVHRDGIDEARLVGLAQDFAATGYGVLTVAAPDLERFRITPQVTDVIEDAAAAVTRHALSPSGKVGIVGVSFSGGLAIVAAGRPSLRDQVAFVVSFGGHGDLSRVMHYLCSGEAQGDLARARRSRAVLGADHVEVHPPHDYGVAVVLLTLADRVVPADQVEPLSRGIDGFLLASSLDMVDKPKAAQEFARMRAYAATLPEPSRTLMTYVNDRAVDKLGPILLPHAATLKDHPAMPALSPERAPAAPAAPVFLLHGADDNVIPSVETVFLGEYLERRTEVHGLLSGLITHAEVNRTAGAIEAWRLASFWRRVMSR